VESTGTGRRRLLLACALALCGLGSLGAGAASAAPGYRLSFGSTAQTTPSGGALVLKGHRSSTSEAMVADQIIDPDGSPTTRAGIGQLVYEEYPGSVSHRHWHYKGFVRYQLRSVADLSLVRPDHKAGFCLSDPIYALDFCGSQKPGLLSVDEGLSPGVSDYYNPLLEGQYIDVADVPPGDYWLVHWVNATKEICESSYANNAAAMKIALWPNGYGRAPYLTTKEVVAPFTPLLADIDPLADCDQATPNLPDLVQKPPAELSVSVVGATGQAPPVTGSPAAPALSKRGAKRYVVKALTRRFGKRPKRLHQSCRRTSPTSFLCRVRWHNRRFRYRGIVRIVTIPTQAGFQRRVNLRVRRTAIHCAPGRRCSKTITAKNMRFKKPGASTAARVSNGPPLTTRVHVGSAGFPAAFPANLADYGAPLGRGGLRGDLAAGGARRASGNAVPAARRLVDLPLLCVPRRVRPS
jgi:Lysyl oxidase